MDLPKSISENLHFLIIEVDTQLANLKRYLATDSTSAKQRIIERGGYAYHLRLRIHESGLAHVGRLRKDGDAQPVRAVEFIATELERIAELCRCCVRGAETISRRRSLRGKSYGTLLQKVAKRVRWTEQAMDDQDAHLALKIGAKKHRMKTEMQRLSDQYIADLKRCKNTEDIVAALSVLRAVEQMGDSLRIISETLISTFLKKPVNIESYNSLKDSVAHLDLEKTSFQPLAETRSGSGISGIRDESNGDFAAIFKDGVKRKLKEERQGVENWNEIHPGLAPKILYYRKNGSSASLLIEHLAGQTFEQILLHESRSLLDAAFAQLSKTLKSVWMETRTPRSIPAKHMDQLAARLDEVYAIHPEFQQGAMAVCGQKLPRFEDLLKAAKDAEAKVKAPFSVYIHGDFNVDNIIYDPKENHINFIDLHRSQHMDCVQDVAVFMVSNYRLQIHDQRLRKRILRVARDFHGFALEEALRAGDTTFDWRLALGLARSFATSTRFILDKTMAHAMYLRAIYLMERVLETRPRHAASFHLPLEEIFFD
ncbi:hypothetical protein JCM17960_02700 [Magnetospira thiophila]